MAETPAATRPAAARGITLVPDDSLGAGGLDAVVYRVER